MNTKLVITFLLVLSLTEVYSQNVKNNLYLLLDRKQDTIIENEESNFKMKYVFVNSEKNWHLRLAHKYSEDHGMRNHYRYELPNQMIKELKRNGNILKIKALIAKIDSFNIAEAKEFFRLHYSYYYDYVYKSRYRTYRRYNLFLIFKSDLDKKYVPCYEVSVLIGRIEHY